MALYLLRYKDYQARAANWLEPGTRIERTSSIQPRDRAILRSSVENYFLQVGDYRQLGAISTGPDATPASVYSFRSVSPIRTPDAAVGKVWIHPRKSHTTYAMVSPPAQTHTGIPPAPRTTIWGSPRPPDQHISIMCPPDLRNQLLASPAPTEPTSDVPMLEWDDLMQWTDARPIKRIYSDKEKVYFKGVKQKQLCNNIPNKDQEIKPLFIKCQAFPEPTNLIDTSRCMRSKLIKSMPTDIDLLNDLKMEAAFLPRTPTLLLQLKSRARKYLANWDLSKYTSTEIHNMVIRAIGAAMLITKEEEKVRALLHMYRERELIRPAHNQFLITGQTGSSPKSGLTRMPSKVNAVSRFLRKHLMPVIKF